MTWYKENFQAEVVEFDPYTDAEGCFVTGGCVSTVGAAGLAIGALTEQEPVYLAGVAGLGMVAVLFFLVYSKLRDTIELDFGKRLLSSKRRFGGWLVNEDNVRFDFFHAVIVSSKSKRDSRSGPLKWSYGLAVITENGKLIKLTEEDQRDFKATEDAARRLSDRIGCRLFPTEPARHLEISSKFPPTISLLTRK